MISLLFILSGPLIGCRYSWAFPVFGQISAFVLRVSKVSSPVTWSITAQLSPTDHTRVSSLLGVEIGVLMFAI